jgi:hypothetical protein
MASETALQSQRIRAVSRNRQKNTNSKSLVTPITTEKVVMKTIKIEDIKQTNKLTNSHTQTNKRKNKLTKNNSYNAA